MLALSQSLLVHITAAPKDRWPIGGAAGFLRSFGMPLGHGIASL
jgi:hypothetical protein